jgi:hypothetical protein
MRAAVALLMLTSLLAAVPMAQAADQPKSKAHTQQTTKKHPAKAHSKKKAATASAAIHQKQK